jgi:hypothetical protein
MGLRTWLLENRLRRIDAKLRALRFRQKKLRDEEADLVKAKKSGLGPMEAKTREEKLHSEREAVTHEVNRLIVEEEKTKAQLREAGVPLTSH